MKRRVIGRVTSDRMQKTIRVTVARRVQERVTGKFIQRQIVCLAHDEANEAKVSDLVEIVESRPLSRHKRWELVRVMSRGELGRQTGPANTFQVQE
jgi:small subunit ribosomal protein S17